MMIRLSILSAIALLLSTCAVAAEPAEVKELQRKQLNTAVAGLKLAEEEFRMGRRGIENSAVWSKRVRDAKLVLAENKNERITAHEEFIKRLQELEKAMKAQHESGIVSVKEVLAATYHLQDAMIELAREKGK